MSFFQPCRKSIRYAFDPSQIEHLIKEEVNVLNMTCESFADWTFLTVPDCIRKSIREIEVSINIL